VTACVAFLTYSYVQVDPSFKDQFELRAQCTTPRYEAVFALLPRVYVGHVDRLSLVCASCVCVCASCVYASCMCVLACVLGCVLACLSCMLERPSALTSKLFKETSQCHTCHLSFNAPQVRMAL